MGENYELRSFFFLHIFLEVLSQSDDVARDCLGKAFFFYVTLNEVFFYSKLTRQLNLS